MVCGVCLGMTIQTGATINVTPLIDVLLVLLIIFMVIVPAHSVGLDVRAPSEGMVVTTVSEAALVVTVLEDGGALLNREKLGAGEWVERLRTVLGGRADRTVFFAAGPDMEFRVVARAIDQARGEGAGQVGLLRRAE